MYVVDSVEPAILCNLVGNISQYLGVNGIPGPAILYLDYSLALGWPKPADMTLLHTKYSRRVETLVLL